MLMILSNYLKNLSLLLSITVIIWSPSFYDADSKMVLNVPWLLVFTHLCNSSSAWLREETMTLFWIEHGRCIDMPWDSAHLSRQQTFSGWLCWNKLPHCELPYGENYIARNWRWWPLADSQQKTNALCWTGLQSIKKLIAVNNQVRLLLNPPQFRLDSSHGWHLTYERSRSRDSR